MERRPFDSSPPIPDPWSTLSPTFSMPMPAINVQMPSADAPYGQSNKSEYPYTPEPSYASEHLASEHAYTPEHPYPFRQPQQPYHVLPSVPLSHIDLPPEPWVPKVSGQSDEEEAYPTTEPVYIPTPQHVQTEASVSRKPSHLQRLASFLGLRPKESTVSRHP
ncbi:hypothetical protein BDR04DRAFT_1102093 [Suillus decipiens]|nr:hypothetical protein BDR04DRAFT_1102093 [Suillus decipiens]